MVGKDLLRNSINLGGSVPEPVLGQHVLSFHFTSGLNLERQSIAVDGVKSPKGNSGKGALSSSQSIDEVHRPPAGSETPRTKKTVDKTRFSMSLSTV